MVTLRKTFVLIAISALLVVAVVFGLWRGEKPRIWSIERGKAFVVLDGRANSAIRPAFRPDGTLLAIVGWDGKVLLWGVSGE